MKIEKANICFFSHTSLLGGAERSLLDLMKICVDEGVKCSIVMTGDGALKSECLKYGIEVKSIVVSPWWATLSENDFNQLAINISILMKNEIEGILAFVNERKVDMIYTQTIVSPLGAIIAEKLDLPHIWALREYGELDHNLKFLGKFKTCMSKMYASSDYVLAVSKDVAKEVLSEDAKNENIIVNYSNITIPIEYQDNRFSLETDKTIKIGIFGSVIEGKNQKDSILAVLKLLENGYKVKLYIVGQQNNIYLTTLIELVEHSKFSKDFIFMDYIENPYELMNEMDIILSCAVSEAMGRTLIEAILLKKPIIYSNKGGQIEVFHENIHGLVYKLYDIDDLAEKIVLTIEKLSETKSRVEEAYKYVVNKFNRETFSNTLLDIIKTQENNVTRREKYVTEFITEEALKRLPVIVSNLEIVSQEKDAKIYNLYLSLQEKEEELYKKSLQLEEKEKQLQQKDKYIMELMSSTSWKVTHPIRLINQKVKRVRLPRYKNLFLPYTKEYILSRKIKNILPYRVSNSLTKILKKGYKSPYKSMPWDEPLTKVSHDLGRNILIIAELSIPQCKKYRVDQKVEMLRSLGYEVSVVEWQDFFLARNKLQLASLVIFYRVPAFNEVLDLFDEVERLGIPSFYDIDDLIFDKKELKKNSNNLKLDAKVQKEIYQGADLYQLALSKCQHAIASTLTLGSYMQKYVDGEVFILNNCLDEQLLTFINQTKDIEKESNKVKIVYGSGTSTHDNDFKEAEEGLLRILETYKQVELVIHGTLTLSKAFDRFDSQITKIPLMSAAEYYQSLNNYDINIAPLENTVFNDAKSNIKYLEASIFKLPTVASSAYEFKSVIKNGINGYIAYDANTWFLALEKLVNDIDLRRDIGREAFDTVMKQYRIEQVAQTNMKPLLEDFILRKETSQINVLMVNILFQPISFGGATIVVEELAKNLNRMQNYNVTLFTGFWNSEKTPMNDHDIVRYEAVKLPVLGVKFPVPMTKELEYKNPNMKKRFIEVLKSVKPDIVHFHSIQQLSASLLEACIDLKIPYIITLHDMWWLCEKQFMIMNDGKYCAQDPIDESYCLRNCVEDKHFTTERNHYLLSLLKQSDLLLTPSLFQSSMYPMKELNQVNVSVNKNGILFPGQNYTKKPLQNRVRFAYLGGNAIHKGYAWLKEIFESIPEENYELVVVDLHKKLGATSINESEWDIRGKLVISNGYEYGQKGLDNFFQDIDVLLFPSQWKESFGLTVREALVRNVWVISTDAGGVTEDIVDGENGNVIDMLDTNNFKNAIQNLLKNPKFFDTYSNKYKDKIRTFNEQTIELDRFYQQVLDTKDV